MKDNNFIILRIARLLSRIKIDPRVTYFNLVRLLSPSYERSIEILRERKPFLITSTGRTGTTVLARMLNTIPENYVVHEPIPKEQYYHRQALMNPDLAIIYIKEFRLREMAYRISRNTCVTYGEVNGALRRHIVALKEAAPFFDVIHIIRDGRDIITSILNRDTLTSKDKLYAQMVPPEKDIHPDEWHSMDRFQKVCWLWSYENNFIEENCDFSVRFEELISNYDYFREHLLKPLDLDLSYQTWHQFTKRPVNATKGLKKYAYADWSQKEKDFFWNTCGKEMTKFGYIK